MSRRQIPGIFLVLFLASASWVSAQRLPTSVNESSRTFAVTGTLRFGDTSQPVEMIKIDLRRFTGETISTTFTRSNGEFEFMGVFRGTYYLMADVEGYEPIKETVEIINTDRRGVVLYLARPFKIVRTEPGGTVSARDFSLPKKARESFEKGRALLLEKLNSKESLPHFQKAIEGFPDYYEAFHLMGVAYAQLGDGKQAEAAYRRSIELSEGEYAPAFVALAALQCDQRRFDEAEDLAQKGVELDPAGWMGHYHLGRALLGLNQVDQAEKSLDEAARRNPDFADIHLVYANVYIRKKDSRSLLAHLEEYLRLAPEGSSVPAVRELRDQLRGQAAARPASKP